MILNINWLPTLAIKLDLIILVNRDIWLLDYDIKIKVHKAFNGYELT